MPVEIIPDSITALVTDGWFLYEKCKCGGKLKHKYRHPDKTGYEVWWYPRLFQFKVFFNNKTIVPLSPIGQLTTKLNQVLNEALT